MMHPDVDDVLAAVLATIEQDIAPHVQDDYAASLCLTVGQLLRSVRARVASEGPALQEDNEDLRQLLARLQAELPAPEAAAVAAALATPRPEGYPTVARLQQEATVLRNALVACIEALPDREHPARAAIRDYLGRQLARQRPWLVEAFTGPRR